MNELNPVLVVILLILILGIILFIFKKKKSKIITSEERSLVHREYEDITEIIDLPLKLQKVDPSFLDSSKMIESDQQLKNYANDILRFAKSNAMHFSKGKEVYEVVFSESIQEEMKKGVARIMNSKDIGYQRAMAVNSHGTIVEHANLKKVKDTVQLKALALNTLTVVVSQEHLQEIRHELEKIQQSLDRLILMQKNEYYGKAKGSYDYLKRAYLFYINGKQNERVLIELESIYRESKESIYFLLNDMKGISNKSSELKQKVWFWLESKKVVNNFREIVNDYKDFEELLNLYFLNLDGCIKLMELHGDPQNIIDQQNLEMTNLFIEVQQEKQDFFKELQSYSEQFKARIATEQHLIKRQEEMQIEIDRLRNEEELNIGRNLPSPPQKIYLTVENGETISIYK